jgi:hypothetical protein
MAEAELRRRQWALPPGPGFWTRGRQAIATALVSIGLRMDAEASSAAITSFRREKRELEEAA